MFKCAPQVYCPTVFLWYVWRACILCGIWKILTNTKLCSIVKTRNNFRYQNLCKGFATQYLVCLFWLRFPVITLEHCTFAYSVSYLLYHALASHSIVNSCNHTFPMPSYKIGFSTEILKNIWSSIFPQTFQNTPSPYVMRHDNVWNICLTCSNTSEHVKNTSKYHRLVTTIPFSSRVKWFIKMEYLAHELYSHL